MTFIKGVPEDQATRKVAEIYNSEKKARGFVADARGFQPPSSWLDKVQGQLGAETFKTLHRGRVY